VLLVLYLGSQVGYAYFGTPPNIPKSQRILFMIVPFFVLPFVSRFPVGLLMYWMTTNLWTVGQGIITRRMVPKPAPPPKRSSRTAPREETAPSVTDSSAEARYLVLPQRPPGTDGWSAEQLVPLVSRDSMIGVARALDVADAER
jgi:hypothetical protein